MANDINGSLDELQRIIEDHWKELLKEATLKVREKLEHLSGQEKSVSISCAVVQSMIEYTEQFVEHSSSDEIVCIHAEIRSHIKKVIKEHRKEMKKSQANGRSGHRGGGELCQGPEAAVEDQC